jgi:hypothetical protein
VKGIGRVVVNRLCRAQAGARRRLPTLTAVAALAVATVVWQSSQSAFTGTTSNPGNSWPAGSVVLGDNDSTDTVKLFTLTNLKPADSTASCVKVTYTGTLPATINLFGTTTTTGTSLDQYLDLTVTRGTIGAATVPDCTGFTADGTTYIGGQAAGVIYANTLLAYPDSNAAGLADPHTTTPNVPEVWTTGETHAYKITATLQNNDSAQGKDASQTFTWQATNTTLYSQVILSDGPTGYWKLDDTSGAAVDSVSARDGAYTNSPSLNQTSGVKDAGTAVGFNGSNQYVNVPYAAALNPAQFTVEAWSKITGGQNAWRTSVTSWYRSGATDRGYYIGAASDNAWRAQVAYGTGWQNLYGPAVSLGTWTHLVATYNGGTLRFYVNGSLVDSAPTPYSANTGSPLGIGATYLSSWSDFHQGQVDEVAVYNYELIQQKVTEHYNAGKK